MSSNDHIKMFAKLEDLRLDLAATQMLIDAARRALPDDPAFLVKLDIAQARVDANRQVIELLAVEIAERN